MGLGLRSSSEDELAARVSGVNVVGGRLVFWVASAAIAALAGSLYAHYVLAILPKAFYFDLTFLSVTMLIVGGRSVSGAVIGTAVDYSDGGDPSPGRKWLLDRLIFPE